MKPLSRAYIALGANLGDPVQTVRAALAALATLPHSRLVATSALYRTAPIGLLEQPDFINAVAALDTALDPYALLQSLQAVEQEFGRVRREKDGPRSLDLDLLLYDQLVVDTPELNLPHPRLHLRAFVIEPLCEIAPPDLALPGRGLAAAWRPAVANQKITRLP